MMNSMEQPNPMRRLLQVVLPVVFLLFSYHSSSPSSVNIFNLNQFINRNVMFLFCNAILLFVARDSGMLAPPVSDLYDEFVAMKGDDEKVNPSVAEEKPILESTVGTLDLVAVVGEEERGEQLELEVVGVEGIEEDLGADELNRRCEEFIEKVKRERIMEASQLAKGLKIMNVGNEAEASSASCSWLV